MDTDVLVLNIWFSKGLKMKNIYDHDSHNILPEKFDPYEHIYIYIYIYILKQCCKGIPNLYSLRRFGRKV